MPGTGRATANVAAPLKGIMRALLVRGFAAVPKPQQPALLVAVRGYGNLFVECAVLL